MRGNARLLFGPLAGVILGFGVAGQALMIPGYTHVQQTVSEIGEVGSPARVPFALMLCCVATCILISAAAVRNLSIEAGHSPLAAYFLAFMAISAAGVGTFAYPHPLHNVFGLSEIIGYQAPAVLALTWRRDARADSGRNLMGCLCAGLGCHRSEHELDGPAEPTLGAREAEFRPRPTSAVRGLVWLVRLGWSAPVSSELAQPRRGLLTRADRGDAQERVGT